MNTALMVVLILGGWLVVSIPVGMLLGALLEKRGQDYPPVNNDGQG